MHVQTQPGQPLTVTLHFTFQESDDKLESVTFPADAAIIPNIGDSIAIRKGYARPIVHRHFLFQPGETHVMIMCQ